MKNIPLIWKPGEGDLISMVGDTYRILAKGEHTNGAFATIDMLIPPGGGPGPHAHADIQESFFVIDGEVEVTSEAGKYTATKGSFIVIPKGGIVHQFKNISEKKAHLLCVVTPAGLEAMFLEAGTPVKAGTFLPPPDEKELEQIKAIAEKHGQKVYPPDYFDKA